nr:MAG TPA: hypothetical protein [Caudoviricetes sp.]
MSLNFQNRSICRKHLKSAILISNRTLYKIEQFLKL